MAQTASGAEPAHRGARHGGIDGLRAFAVVAAVLYHVDHRLLPGGFVGVDLFFVLSGYLITTLLIGEHRRHGSISLRGFWARRIRRLWPLAWLTLSGIAVASIAGAWGPDRQRSVPAELLASFLQVANWYQINHDGYVQSFAAPSPVRHFWSLAIEEQFYLVWPVAVAAALAAGRRMRLAIPVLIGGVLLAGVIAGFAHAGDPDRVYLGTDVRMVALAVGAALAWGLRATPLRAPRSRAVRRLATVLGLVGAVALGAACFVLQADWIGLARGGFLVIALAAGSVVALSLSSRRAGAMLAWAPLVWLGRVSFAVYLVHWPALVALGPGRPLWLRLFVALPVSIVVAGLLHVMVERPIIERPPGWRPLSIWAASAAAVSSIALLIAVPEGPTPTEQVAETLETVPDPIPRAKPVRAENDRPPPGGTPSSTVCVPPTAPPVTFSETGAFDPSTVGAIVDPVGTCGRPTAVLVVGDSTGRGAANGLAALGDQRVQIWDRTTLGCSFGDEGCPDWRAAWADAVAAIRPDVVLVFTGVVDDFRGVDDPPFMSDDAATTRDRELSEAAQLLGSGGAAVRFVTVAPPRRPNGLFFCDGRGRNSRCDPEWVVRWNEAVRRAGAGAGAGVVGVADWIILRGSTAEDRPDGLHFAGPALVEFAQWLLPQLVDASTPVG